MTSTPGARGFRAPLLTVAMASLTVGHVLPAPAPRQAAEPPCRAGETDSLAFMVGEWSVRSRTQDQTGEWVETAARAEIRTRLGGCLIEEVWEGELGGEPHRFVKWLAWDRDLERWERAMVDDAHGALLTSQGHWSNGRLRLFHTQFRGGQLLLDRTTIRPVEDGRFRWVLESSYDGGATWQTVWTMEYRRSGGPTGARSQTPSRGRVEEIHVRSPALERNLLGDPSERRASRPP